MDLSVPQTSETTRCRSIIPSTCVQPDSSAPITAAQTETITNRMTCGSAHERTMLLLADDSGPIEVIDQGACGKNVSALKTPIVKVGEQINLPVHIMVTKNPELREAVSETTIRFLDRVRY